MWRFQIPKQIKLLSFPPENIISFFTPRSIYLDTKIFHKVEAGDRAKRIRSKEKSKMWSNNKQFMKITRKHIITDNVWEKYDFSVWKSSKDVLFRMWVWRC